MKNQFNHGEHGEMETILEGTIEENNNLGVGECIGEPFPMKTRCKFVVRQAVTEYNNAGPTGQTRFRLEAVCDAWIPENQAFTKWTPQGVLEVTVSNPMAAAMLSTGGYFYLDLIPAVVQKL